MSYGIVALVSAISANIVAALANAGYPTLTDGKVLLGRQHQFEQSAPPRIIWTPVSSIFTPRAVSSASYLQPAATGGNAGQGVPIRSVTLRSRGAGYTSAPTITFTGVTGTGAAATAVVSNGGVVAINISNPGSGYTSPPVVTFSGGGGSGAMASTALLPANELQAEAIQRSLYTEQVTFECRCWGTQPGTDDPDFDFDFTQALYQQVIRSCRTLAVGSFELVGQGRGEWTDGILANSQLIRDGREFVFRFAIDVPVLGRLLQYSPPATAGTVDLQLVASDGSVIDEVDFSI